MIRGDVVENVILWDGDLLKWQPPEGVACVKASGSCGIGWTWDGETFIAPVVPEPPAELPPAE